MTFWRVNRRAEKGKDASAGYYTGEHILICLSSSPSNARVIRTAARLSDAFHGRFTALFVEVPGTRELNGESLARLRGNLRLAEQLGARTSPRKLPNTHAPAAFPKSSLDVPTTDAAFCRGPRWWSN